MIRNLKALGLALVVVFAIGAMAASAASAQNGMLTSDGPMTLNGTQTGSVGANTITAFKLKTECGKATYTGHRYNVTPHELIPVGETTATITPHYGVCSTTGAICTTACPSTVDMNGCDYVFHLGATTGVDQYAVTTTIICPVNSHVVVTMFTPGTVVHEAAKNFCNLTITENPAGYTGLTATDTTNGHIDIAGILTGVEVHKKTTATDSKPLLCSEETEKKAEIAIDITVEGKNGSGEKTNIGLSHT